MPPANISSVTAVDLGTLPASVTQTDINDAGVNYTVWYKFTAPVGAVVVGVFGYGGHVGTGYRPVVFPFDSTVTSVLSIAGQNKPIQFPVTPGQVYYLQFVKDVNSAGPESLTVSAQVHTEVAVASGDIIINDDTTGFPLAVIDTTADNTVKAFVPGIAAGEAGDITLNGVMALEDSGTDSIKLYDADFNLITSLDTSAFGTTRIRCCRAVDKFYAGFSASPPIVKVISEAGAYLATYTLTGATSLGALAADNDEAILYHAGSPNTSVVARWDLVGNVALSNLVAGIAGYRIPDIFVLGDDSILVLYWDSVAKDIIVKRYSAAGATLNTYAIGVQTGSTMPRGAYALDDPASFWLLTHSSPGTSVIKNVRISDGVVLTTRSIVEFEGGLYQEAETATPTSRFGNSFSCPILIMTVSEPVITPGGIYELIPEKRNDTIYTNVSTGQTEDVEIPNPFIKTGLIGS